MPLPDPQEQGTILGITPPQGTGALADGYLGQLMAGTCSESQRTLCQSRQCALPELRRLRSRRKNFLPVKVTSIAGGYLPHPLTGPPNCVLTLITSYLPKALFKQKEVWFKKKKKKNLAGEGAGREE